MNVVIEELIDLIEPDSQALYDLSVAEAKVRILSGDASAVRAIEGSFALVAQAGRTVRMARSLDRPMRYFLAKRTNGPALIVAERIDAIHQWLRNHGMEHQFHPSYTRMAPAHYVTELQLVGCPDPDPVYTRFFDPPRNALSTDLDEIGRAYIGALTDEVARWIDRLPTRDPIGVCFSGGIDSGAVFLAAYHVLLKRGMNPGRLKAFTLDFGDGPDLAQARRFLESMDLGMFLEPIAADPEAIDLAETVRVVEDYKPLDIEAASMVLALCRGIRARYPDWKYLLDGDGGDENLKDYPIEDNPELTIRSVVNNSMLYQEGWGVGRIKHSLTYSGGLSRSYARTYAPVTACGFAGFSPFTRPRVIAVAEGIPFIALTDYNEDRLYALKGDIVRRGIKAVTGLDMPAFPKRRFQHGALSEVSLRRRLPDREAVFRRSFLQLYAS